MLKELKLGITLEQQRNMSDLATVMHSIVKQISASNSNFIPSTLAVILNLSTKLVEYHKDSNSTAITKVRNNSLKRDI